VESVDVACEIGAGLGEQAFYGSHFRRGVAQPTDVDARLEAVKKFPLVARMAVQRQAECSESRVGQTTSNDLEGRLLLGDEENFFPGSDGIGDHVRDRL
jgi:hypothetical protein